LIWTPCGRQLHRRRAAAMNLTRRTVDSLEARSKRCFVWDTVLKGFGIRVEPTGHKTFLCRYRAGGARRQYLLGIYGAVTPEEARNEARRVLSSSVLGKDLAQSRYEARRAAGFSELVEIFLTEHVSKLKPGTAVEYEGALRRHAIPAIGRTPADAVTTSGLNRLHVALSDHRARANRVISYTRSLFTVHQFRHAAAATILKQRPGDYEFVRRILGHRNVQTTMRFYTGLEAFRAGEHFGQLIEERIQHRQVQRAIGGAGRKDRKHDGDSRSQAPRVAHGGPQRAWAEACRPGGRLNRGGRAAHLKPVTRLDLARRYGLFLDFLVRTGRMTPQASASRLINLENVTSFIADLKSRVSSVSVHGAIAKLRRMGELLDPHWDSVWLRDIEQELAWEMRPTPKFDRFVEAGQRLMQKAEDSSQLAPHRRAMLFRNGLMLALLAVCPIRLRNLAALEIGTTLRKVDDRWLIALPTAETKTGRADERLAPQNLCAALERYLAVYRMPKRSDETMLCIGRTGDPLGYSGVERTITETARSELGIAVNPLLFRDCAASTAYRHAGQTPGLAAALLNHTDPRVTERHYNRAKSASFAVEFGKMIQEG
jgi:integrase/recombinase XerD